MKRRRVWNRVRVKARSPDRWIMQLGLRSADDETGGKNGSFGRMKMEEPRGRWMETDFSTWQSQPEGIVHTKCGSDNCNETKEGIITQNIGARIFLSWEFFLSDGGKSRDGGFGRRYPVRHMVCGY